MKRMTAVIGIMAVLGSSAAYGEQASSRGTESAQTRQGVGGGAGQQGVPRIGPPPEAFKACEGKTAGSKAQFTNPEGEIVTGICRTADGRLVLRPDHPKEQGRDGRHGPPPEAYQACEGRSSGAVAQFTDPRGEVLKGICEEENGRMVLRPDSSTGGGQREGRGER